MNKAQFGMVGLGTMGRNFLLNVAEQGFTVAGYDIEPAKRALLLNEAQKLAVSTAETLESFVASLARPRNVMLLVPAGKITDSVINDLIPLLEKDDLIIDGGNSHFLDTERREVLLSAKGIEFMGVGVSGGEEGARHGASIMPGGRLDFYERIAPVLQAVSAKVEGEPCVAYMGASSAGHFVKMVHNGIEYGLMQILAETYDFMLRVVKLSYDEMSEVFARWNATELNSFLVEITSEVLKKIDAETGRPLVEMVLDKAAQKGTGKWTSQAAMDFGVPIPTIDAAVAMRQISAQKEVRLLMAKKFSSEESVVSGHLTDGTLVHSEPQFDLKAELAAREHETVVSLHHKSSAAEQSGFDGETLSKTPATDNNERIKREFDDRTNEFLERLKNALLCSFIATYAQGLSLLQTASVEKNYNLNLAEIARIWRGGCIIRSTLLEEMRRAYSENPALTNLLLDDHFAGILNQGRADWRFIVEKFSESRVPALCLSSALAYFDAFRSERLPANLIQAQRDFFGAHTYQRVDRDGIFHTPDWNS